MGTVRYTVIDGEIIAEKRNGVRRQYVPDSLGSTVALLDNTQTQTDTFTYWPYGEVASRTGTTPTPFQFVGTQGYYRDSTSKMYVRARYLDTQKGRWLTEDPIGFQGRDWNLFRYVKNAPISFVDPSGLINWCCWHIHGDCYGTCCQNEKGCPPRKSRPLPGKPAPPPKSSPISIPKVPSLPYCPDPGGSIPMSACEMFCNTFLCPPPLNKAPIICEIGCKKLCKDQTQVRSIAAACHKQDNCSECCQQMLGDFSGDASTICVVGCGGGPEH